jgi:hypothetical protein
MQKIQNRPFRQPGISSTPGLSLPTAARTDFARAAILKAFYAMIHARKTKIQMEWGESCIFGEGKYRNDPIHRNPKSRHAENGKESPNCNVKIGQRLTARVAR